jgi:AcrR family transcriptional regulator
MSPNPLDHIAAAHQRIADAHRQALDAHKQAANERKAARGSASSSGGSAVIRDQLIDAAERLLQERPVSALTTRDIARAAGLSDGVLYNYFANKNDLLVAALLRRYDAWVVTFEAGLPVAGEGDVEANLRVLAEAILGLTTATIPAVSGLMSEADLMHQFLAELHGDERGLQRTLGRVGAYLTEEQALKRLGAFDVDAAVTTLVGSMIALGLSGMVTGRSEEETRGQVRGIVAALLGGLEP